MVAASMFSDRVSPTLTAKSLSVNAPCLPRWTKFICLLLDCPQCAYNNDLFRASKGYVDGRSSVREGTEFFLVRKECL